MSRSLTIRGGRLVLPDRCVTGDLLVEDGVITEIGPSLDRVVGEEIDATGLTVLPGAVDGHVVASTDEGDLVEAITAMSHDVGRAGVTTMLVACGGARPLTSASAHGRVLDEARARCAVHVELFITALAGSEGDVADAERACGIQLFGVAQGLEAFEPVFRNATCPVLLPVATLTHGQLAQGLELGHKHGTRVHLSGVERVAAELDDASSHADRVSRDVHVDVLRADVERELWAGLHAGLVSAVASGHRAAAPRAHLLLPTLLDEVVAGRLELPSVARWLCEAPALSWGLARKGRLEVGYDGDLALADLSARRAVATYVLGTRV